MKKAKLKTTIKNNNVTKETNSYSLKELIKIIIIMLGILGVFYLITVLIAKPVDKNNSDNSVAEIDHTKITLNNLLNRNSDEYYVLAMKKSLYNSVNIQIKYPELYNNYIKEYTSLENSLPFYTVDLDDALNKNYIGDELNISNNLNEIKLNDEVLFKVKNGEIKDYFVGNSKIIEALSNLKESIK